MLTHRIKSVRSPRPSKKMDHKEFARAVLELMDDSAREEAIRQLIVQVTVEILDTASHYGNSPVPIPMCEDGIEARSLVQEFLTQVRPFHEGAGYFGAYWSRVLEAAWPEGLAHVLFGPPDQDRFWAAELFGAVDAIAEHARYPTPHGFEASDFLPFIAEWRSCFLRELSAIRSTAKYSGFPPLNVKASNATPLSQHISSLFRKAKEDPGAGLVLARLAFWAQENLTELDWQQVHPLVEAVLRVELQNAPALYANLAQAPGLMQAPDLETAAHLLVQHLVSIAPPA